MLSRLWKFQIEKPSKSGPIKKGKAAKSNPYVLYVQLSLPSNWSTCERHGKVKEILEAYGVVTLLCLKANEDELTNDDKLLTWWYVSYMTVNEMKFAEYSLTMAGINVSRTLQPPNAAKTTKVSKTDKVIELNELKSSSNNGMRSSAGDATDETPLQVKTVQPLKAALDTPYPFDDSSNSCRCCAHLQQHPKTVCCGCPYVCCFTVFVCAAFVCPIAVVLLASDLGLGLFKVNSICILSSRKP